MGSSLSPSSRASPQQTSNEHPLSTSYFAGTQEGPQPQEAYTEGSSIGHIFMRKLKEQSSVHPGEREVQRQRAAGLGRVLLRRPFSHPPSSPVWPVLTSPPDVALPTPCLQGA